MHKEGSGMIWLEKRGMLMVKRHGERKLKQKLTNLASWDNGIKMDVVIVVGFILYTENNSDKLSLY